MVEIRLDVARIATRQTLFPRKKEELDFKYYLSAILRLVWHWFVSLIFCRARCVLLYNSAVLTVGTKHCRSIVSARFGKMHSTSSTLPNYGRFPALRLPDGRLRKSLPFGHNNLVSFSYWLVPLTCPSVLSIVFWWSFSPRTSHTIAICHLKMSMVLLSVYAPSPNSRCQAPCLSIRLRTRTLLLYWALSFLAGCNVSTSPFIARNSWLMCHSRWFRLRHGHCSFDLEIYAVNWLDGGNAGAFRPAARLPSAVQYRLRLCF